MKPLFVLAGHLKREYILPPAGHPLLDALGGSLAYAAGGLAVWASHAGLLAKVGEDYPKDWLNNLKKRGFDIKGIRVEPTPLDLRYFLAYAENNERSSSNAISHFTKRQMAFPKSLLGYQPPDEGSKHPREIDPLSPVALDVPKNYRDAGFVHLCPFDFTSQSQMVNLFGAGSNQTVSLDPAPAYMNPTFWRDLRIVLQGVKIFLPSEEEIRALFWGETNDLWQMAQRIAEFGPQVVVIKRGGNGQMIYDAENKKKYEVPSYPSRVADPTGVGHAYCGGFLAGYQKTGGDVLKAALHGAVSASLKIEGSGPFYPLDVLPGLAEARLHSLEQMTREA